MSLKIKYNYMYEAKNWNTNDTILRTKTFFIIISEEMCINYWNTMYTPKMTGFKTFLVRIDL
jgi:hypothetical protein